MIIGGLQRFSLTDFPGKSVAIIFTQGCNFRCSFCHNLGLLDRNVKPVYSEKEVFSFLRDRQGQLDGVVITGGEPTIQKDLYNFILKIKELHYAVKLDTNGSRPDILKTLIDDEILDYIAMDIKAPWASYNALCRVDVDLAAIQKSIDLIATSGVLHVFRTTWAKALLRENDIETIRKILPIGSPYIVQDEVYDE